MPKPVEYEDNLEEYVRAIRRAGITMQVAAANTLNLAAEYIAQKYTENLKQHFTFRNKYTLGKIKVHKSNPVRKSRQLRKLEDVNAIVGVQTLKGGRENYLLHHEIGKVVEGSSKTGGMVPTPLVAARVAQSPKRVIAKAYRIDKNTVNREKFRNLYRLNARRQYGAMISRAQRGEIDGDTLYQTNRGIFKIDTDKFRIKMVRYADRTRLYIRSRDFFRDAIGQMTTRRMRHAFIMSAQRMLRHGRGLPA